MRLVSLVAAAAMAVAVPSAASAVVMVAHFGGEINGIHGTGSDRFGVPPLFTFSGPFEAEFIFDTEGGTAVSAGVGGQGRSGGAIESGWIEWHGGAARIDFPSIEAGRVLARLNGFSVQAVHTRPDGSFDSVTVNAGFTHNGRLDALVGPLTVNSTGSVGANHYENGVLVVDLFGQTEGSGMPLQVTSFSLSEYVAPSAAPEPATWALMIGGFGAAGAMLRRRLALA